MKPIALLITVYNNQSGLEKTLLSLIPDSALMDIVIVDDGSALPVDLSKFSELSIHLIRLPNNLGIETAANMGLEYLYGCHYEFLARIDAGDVALNHRFSKQLAFLRENPAIGIVGSRINVVNTHGNLVFSTYHPIKDREIRNAMCFSNILHHPTLMVRTDVMKKIGFYSPRFFATGDYDLCLRILKITKAENMAEHLLNYEWDNQNSISNKTRRLQKMNALKVQLLHFDKYNIYSYMGVLRSFIQIIFFVPKHLLRIENTCMRFMFRQGKQA